MFCYQNQIVAMDLRKYVYVVFLAFCFLSFQQCGGCGGNYSGSTRHSNTQTHSYDSAPTEPKALTETDKRIQQYEEQINKLQSGASGRDIWQKPGVVLDLLGDLEDKVVADIGAGPYGYFSLAIASKPDLKKVIAIDIDQDAIDFIGKAKEARLQKADWAKLETRLVTEDNPKLKPEEADIILIVNTVTYFENRLNYLRNLKKGLAKGGRLMIIDYKKKKIPIVARPIEERIALGQLENELITAGYQLLSSDDKTLEFQYILTASKP